MGQHKHNPVASAAKNGELPPKPKKMGKREAKRLMYAKCQEMLYKGLVDALEGCRRSCENCGNIRCKNSIVAYNWVSCVRSGFTKGWMPLPEPPKGE